MSQQTATFSSSTPQTSANTFWKWLWRADALFNLALSDVLTFAARTVAEAFDMADSAVTPLRLLGVVLAIYGLLQLWIARNGRVPKWAYQLAAVDMDIAGTGLIVVLIAGVDMNTAGVVTTALLTAGSYIMAALWFVRSRQLA